MEYFLNKICKIIKRKGDFLKKVIKIIGIILILLLIIISIIFIENDIKKENISYAASSYGTSDIQLMARAINGEARGEPYEGQVAVGAVILNRVKSADFPNTISGVIYQPWAFTAVNDGQINLEPNQSAYNAARDAMNGWDPTYGALYYYNAKTATDRKSVV